MFRIRLRLTLYGAIASIFILSIALHQVCSEVQPQLYERSVSETRELKESADNDNSDHDYNSDGVHENQRRCDDPWSPCPSESIEPIESIESIDGTVTTRSTFTSSITVATITWTPTPGPYKMSVTFPQSAIASATPCAYDGFYLNATYNYSNCSTEVCITGFNSSDLNYDGFAILNSNLDAMPRFRPFDYNHWIFSEGVLRFMNIPWIPFPAPESACFTMEGKRRPVRTNVFVKFFDQGWCRRSVILPLQNSPCNTTGSGEYYETSADLASDPDNNAPPCSNLSLRSNTTCSKRSCNSKLCFQLVVHAPMYNITTSNLLDPAERTPNRNSSTSSAIFNVQKARCWSYDEINNLYYFNCGLPNSVSEDTCIDLSGKFYNPSPEMLFQRISDSQCLVKVSLQKTSKSCATTNGNVLGLYPDCRNVKVTGRMTFDPIACYSRFCYTVDPLGQSTNLDQFTLTAPKDTQGILYPASENNTWTIESNGLLRKKFPWPLTSPFTSCFILPGKYSLVRNLMILYSGNDDVCYKQVSGPGVRSTC